MLSIEGRAEALSAHSHVKVHTLRRQQNSGSGVSRCCKSASTGPLACSIARRAVCLCSKCKLAPPLNSDPHNNTILGKAIGGSEGGGRTQVTGSLSLPAFYLGCWIDIISCVFINLHVAGEPFSSLVSVMNLEIISHRQGLFTLLIRMNLIRDLRCFECAWMHVLSTDHKKRPKKALIWC